MKFDRKDLSLCILYILEKDNCKMSLRSLWNKVTDSLINISNCKDIDDFVKTDLQK